MSLKHDAFAKNKNFATNDPEQTVADYGFATIQVPSYSYVRLKICCNTVSRRERICHILYKVQRTQQHHEDLIRI